MNEVKAVETGNEEAAAAEKQLKTVVSLLQICSAAIRDHEEEGCRHWRAGRSRRFLLPRRLPCAASALRVEEWPDFLITFISACLSQVLWCESPGLQFLGELGCSGPGGLGLGLDTSGHLNLAQVWFASSLHLCVCVWR